MPLHDWRCVGNALRWAEFRSQQSYQTYTDCLLQWSASIAEEDGSNRTVVAVAGCDVIMKLTASGRALSVLASSLTQTDTEVYRPSEGTS